MTAESGQIRPFRGTGEAGPHTNLTYLRDRRLTKRLGGELEAPELEFAGHDDGGFHDKTVKPFSKLFGESVLELSHGKARPFFLKAGRPCSLDLPPYLVFGDWIRRVDKILLKARTGPPSCKKRARCLRHNDSALCSLPGGGWRVRLIAQHNRGSSAYGGPYRRRAG